MLGTAGLPHILMRFYTVPDAKTARTSVGYATAFIGCFYLLTFVLGFGAMVIVGREAITAIDAGGNMAAPLLAAGCRRHAVPRLHLRGGIRHHPGGRRRPDALGRGDAVARPVGARRASRGGQLAGRVHGGAPGDGGAGGRLGRAGHRVQGAERRLHGGPRLRDRRQREFPGAGAVDLLEAADHRRRAGQHDRRDDLHAVVDLPVAGDPDRHPESRVGLVPAAQPRHRDDSAVVRGGGAWCRC